MHLISIARDITTPKKLFGETAEKDISLPTMAVIYFYFRSAHDI